MTGIRLNLLQVEWMFKVHHSAERSPLPDATTLEKVTRPLAQANSGKRTCDYNFFSTLMDQEIPEDSSAPFVTGVPGRTVWHQRPMERTGRRSPYHTFVFLCHSTESVNDFSECSDEIMVVKPTLLAALSCSVSSERCFPKPYSLTTQQSGQTQVNMTNLASKITKSIWFVWGGHMPTQYPWSEEHLPRWEGAYSIWYVPSEHESENDG